MKISHAPGYPDEGFSVIYDSSLGEVFQIIFYSDTFGIFTRMDKRWRGLTSDDTSLNDLSVLDISPEDYKRVRDMFDAAQEQGRLLRFDEVEPYTITYAFEAEEDAGL